MLNSFHPDRTFIACGYTDLRRGIDGLATIMQEQFKLDPFTNTLFLFCGRRCDRIKGLYWDKDGFVLLYKRLEKSSFQWPCRGCRAFSAGSRAALPQLRYRNGSHWQKRVQDSGDYPCAI